MTKPGIQKADGLLDPKVWITVEFQDPEIIMVALCTICSYHLCLSQTIGQKDGFSCRETCVHNSPTHICNSNEPPMRSVYNSVILEQGKQCRVLIVIVIWNNKGK